MKISNSSAWNQSRIFSFLSENTIPIRLAVIQDKHLLICSVWFSVDPETLVISCVSHRKSQLVKSLMADPRVGFEIALNEPPYKGVRGKGNAKLTQENVSNTLHEVIVHFLGSTDSKLARWLLGRAEEEYVIKITPSWITSWDYSERM
tara:strand:+ start:1129 stop:1572 length:444 start_codon:yes stop_codon:yes gene_type:complete